MHYAIKKAFSTLTLSEMYVHLTFDAIFVPECKTWQ